MTDEDKLLKNRFAELSMRADKKKIYCFSDFLNLSEQDILLSVCKNAMLYGGYEEAERRVAKFGKEETLGWDEPFPITVLKIMPRSERLCESLCHRDFLGSLVGLGIRREKLGDIIVFNNCGYLFCLNEIAEYIIENLEEIRHTAVFCEESVLPPEALPKLEEKYVVIASERLDALVSAVFKLSRSDSQELFLHKKIFVNGRLCENASKPPEENCIVSVRGFGRFAYRGMSHETKKGRLGVLVEVYES